MIRLYKRASQYDLVNNAVIYLLLNENGCYPVDVEDEIFS
jgi:hypothetical protein